jgi:hypothetical protein
MRSWPRRLARLLLAHQGLPLLWIALTAIALIPIWGQRLIPHVDAPNHLALIRGWHNYHQPAWHISDYFELRIRPVPYIAYYGLVHLLMYAFSIETAYKITLSLYVVLFPLSALALTRALRRHVWYSVFAFPLIFSQCWAYGFASHLISVALFGFTLAALLRYLDSGNRVFLYVLLPLSILTYFFHILPWFCLGLSFLTLLVVKLPEMRRLVTAAAALLPSLLIAIASTLAERSENVYFLEGRSDLVAYWIDFPASLKEFATRVCGLFAGSLDEASVYVSLACLALLLVSQRIQRDAPPLDLSTRRLHALFIVFFFAYLALPTEIKSPIKWFYISQRLPTFIMLFLMLRPRVSLDGWRRALVIPAVVFAVVIPLKMSRLYRSFSARNVGFILLVQQVPIGATCLVVPRGMRPSMTMDPAAMGPVYDHFGSWPMALRGGYSHFVFDQGVPIRPKRRLATPSFWSGDTFDFRQAPEYEYYLVRNPPSMMRREPALRVEDEVGEWVLFHRAHDISDEP